MTTELPADWDWVTERSRCSVVSMFHTLKTLAKRDVDKRLALRTESSFGQAFGLIFHDHSDSQFAVTRVSPSGESLVVFTHDLHLIRVEGNGTKLVAGLTLTNDGKCKLKVGEQELAPWQLLRLVLEPLFF